MNLTLYPYQTASNQAARDIWKGGEKKKGALLVLPTGTGKTVTALKMVSEALGAGHRVLWLAHRLELLTQPRRALESIWPHLAPLCGFIRGAEDEAHKQMVFGSADTLRNLKRLDLYLDAGAPMLVVVDESHHYVGNLYEKLLLALDDAQTCTHGRPFRLGLTATPDRSDGKGMGGLWRLAFHLPLPDAIDDGYLAPPVFHKHVLPGLVLPEEKGADWSDEVVEARLRDAEVADHVVQVLNGVARGRKSLAFFPTVALARVACEAAQAAGLRAEWVSGESDEDHREAVLMDFADGRLDVLCNCAVLTEGTDLPACDCIVMGRPTMSRGLYTQIIGRGLRKYPGKADCLVVDLVGATDVHRMVTLPILLDALRSKRGSTDLDTWGQEAKEPDPETVRTWTRTRRVPRTWVALTGLTRDVWLCDAGEHGVVALVLANALAGLWRPVLVKRRSGHQDIGEPVSLELAMGLGEEVARMASGLTYEMALWRTGTMTEQQDRLLRSVGVHLPPDTLAGVAADEITRQVGTRSILREGLAGLVKRAS